ncbi:hypothetical protein Droror1_Dr00010310 [Drosera rotundifolia]
MTWFCRVFVQEYTKFRGVPIQEAAIKLAENGKIGALNSVRRHPYSLAPYVLEVLSAIPETVPVQTYNQLLPGRFPPKASIRTQDWVESEKVVNYIGGLPRMVTLEISAANQLELCLLVIEEGCRDPHSGFLRDEMEAIDCLLGCIYSSSAIDKWSTMASLLWTLQQFEGSDHFQRLELQIRSAEFHIEAGRLLALYQVSNLALLYMQILFLRFLFQLICAFYVPTHHGFTISSLDTDFCYHSFLVG